MLSPVLSFAVALPGVCLPPGAPGEKGITHAPTALALRLLSRGEPSSFAISLIWEALDDSLFKGTASCRLVVRERDAARAKWER